MADPVAIAFLVGRVLLGAFFLIAAWAHIRHYRMLADYAAAKKVPFPVLATLGTGALLAGGGLSLVLGWYPYVGLAFLAAFFIGTTPLMHAFWTIKDPATRESERTNFVRNAALLGAVLALTAVPEPWSYSVTTLLGI